MGINLFTGIGRKSTGIMRADVVTLLSSWGGNVQTQEIFGYTELLKAKIYELGDSGIKLKVTLDMFTSVGNSDWGFIVKASYDPVPGGTNTVNTLLNISGAHSGACEEINKQYSGIIPLKVSGPKYLEFISVGITADGNCQDRNTGTGVFQYIE